MSVKKASVKRKISVTRGELLDLISLARGQWESESNLCRLELSNTLPLLKRDGKGELVEAIQSQTNLQENIDRCLYWHRVERDTILEALKGLLKRFDEPAI